MTHSYSSNTSPRALAPASLIAALALVALVPRQVKAQSEGADCVAVVSEMLGAAPSATAIRASGGCPVSGPVTLAQRWARRGARGTMERAALVDASASLRDARVYEAVSSVARDEEHTIADRLAAVRVMLRYAEDDFAVTQQGQPIDGQSSRAWDARRLEASMTIAGSVALAPTVRADVKRELSRLAVEDRDPEMRLLAQRACETIGYVAPKGARVARIARADRM